VGDLHGPRDAGVQPFEVLIRGRVGSLKVGCGDDQGGLHVRRDIRTRKVAVVGVCRSGNAGRLLRAGADGAR